MADTVIPKNNSSVKTITVVSAIVGLIGVVSAILASVITPLRSQITALKSTVAKTETRFGAKVEKLVDKISVLEKESSATTKVFQEVEKQFQAAAAMTRAENKRTLARLTKFDDWQQWWYRQVHSNNGQREERIRSLERSVFGDPRNGPLRE